MNEDILLFVYGTLKRCGRLNHKLKSATFLAEGNTTLKYKMLGNSGFPYVMKENGPSQIRGEVYVISNNTLLECDITEGHPNFYKRELIEVITDKGEKVFAWLYFGNTVEERCRNVSVEIPHGEFPVNPKEWYSVYTELFRSQKGIDLELENRQVGGY